MSWEIKKLDEIVYVKSGKRLPKGHSFIEEKTNFEYIRARDIKNGKIKIESPVYISEETYNKISKYTVSENDVVITIVGANVGDIAIINSNYNGANLTENAAKLIPKNKTILSPRFLKYSLFGDNQKSKFQQIAMAAAQPKLGFYKIKDFEIGLPAIEIQNRIADILSDYDDLIENNLKRIKLLEQAAQNIYKEWFVNMRFPGHENTTTNSGTGLPVGWEQKELGEIISKLESGSRPKGGIDKTLKVGVPSIGAESIRGLGYFDFSKTKYVNRDFFLKMKKGRLNDKDILIYKDGAYIGRSTLFQDSFPFEECSINEHVFLIHSSNELLQYYLYFTLHSNVYYEKMQNLNSNAAQPGINQTKIKTLLILVPVDDILIEFDKLISPIVKQIYVLAKENLKSKNARDILLPRLMNQTIEV